jgi:hypothetical protein
MKMTEKIKKQISSKTFLCVIALVALMGFSLVSCNNNEPKEKKVSGTVTANADGEVLFMYSRLSSNSPASCTFTTNLPAPNDQFVLTVTATETTGKKTIEGLEAGQKVTWTATVEGAPANLGSGNFVHINNN